MPRKCGGRSTRVGEVNEAEDRIRVGRDLRSFSHPDVYVVGDAAAASGAWGDQLAMGCRTGGFTGPHAADEVVVSRLTGRDVGPFRFRYIHERISLGRKHGFVQFLRADEMPKEQILTGRKGHRVQDHHAEQRAAAVSMVRTGLRATPTRHCGAAGP
jgi:NADH dehydrogenase